jgi:hypothetical protein
VEDSNLLEYTKIKSMWNPLWSDRGLVKSYIIFKNYAILEKFIALGFVSNYNKMSFSIVGLGLYVLRLMNLSFRQLKISNCGNLAYLFQ